MLTFFQAKWKLVIIPLFIVGLGIVVRFYQLNRVPMGYFWDEVAIAYNAWSISDWFRDEYGTFMPISFRSFGDYKSSLFIYLLAPIFKLFEFKLIYARVYSALIGSLNIALVMLLARTLFENYKNRYLMLSLSGLLMALLPWTVHFSRIATESQLVLFLIMAGILLGMKGFLKHSLWYFASVSFGLSIYAYHSAKIFLPIFLLLIFILFRKKVLKNLRSLVGPAILLLLILLPAIYDTLFQNGFTRGGNLVFFADSHVADFDVIATRLGSNVLNFLKPDFWIFGQDAIGLRHSPQGSGFIFVSVFILLLIGLIYSIKKRKKYWAKIALSWLIAGLIPSILTQDSPHAIRAMLAVVPVILISVVGVEVVVNYLIKIFSIKITWLYAVFTLIVLIEAGWYYQKYYSSYAIESAAEFQYGYEQVVASAEDFSGGNKRIEFTTYYGQPYMYVLVYKEILPKEYINGALSLYKFYDLNNNEFEENVIYVGTEEELSDKGLDILDIIRFPDNSIAFIVAQMSD